MIPRSRSVYRTVLSLAMLLMTAAAVAQDAEFLLLDEETRRLKQEVLQLNADLLALQEKVLFPPETQVSVFLTMDVGDFFALDFVRLQLDGEEVTDHLYDESEIHALLKGGAQRLYIGNVSAGPHELVALYHGTGPHEREYLRGATLRFDKQDGIKLLELRIADNEASLRPDFQIKAWE